MRDRRPGAVLQHLDRAEQTSQADPLAFDVRRVEQPFGDGQGGRLFCEAALGLDHLLLDFDLEFVQESVLVARSGHRSSLFCSVRMARPGDATTGAARGAEEPRS
ncbi:hypothetical protein AAH991_31310 [Microbispora sp. ZYX-F-249]|uniref:Uncharacterized protein n=1 Tax=Microbispora maris TaxID=3144104 RepID=A0ABV0AWJ4_9ACTN